MTSPAVTFNFDAWAAEFPEFAGLTAPQAQGYFNRASIFLANDTCNPAFGAGVLQSLLYLITAHIAFINAPRTGNDVPSSSGQQPSSVVGRINSAGQGSVNVGTEWNTSGSPSEAYYLQSKYGAEAFQGMAQFRTMLYMANPTYVPSAIFPYRGGRIW